MRTVRFLVLGVCVLLAAACDMQSPTAAAGPALQASLAASPVTSSSGFHFLAPIAREVSLPAGVDFDASLDPTVEIRELHESGAGALVSSLSTRGTGRNARGGRGHYQAEWHTRDNALDPATHYRIVVKVAGTELGHADVDLVRNRAGLRSVDTSRYIGVVAGSTLPVRFWVGEGHVAVVGSAGGTFSLQGGAVTLVVPAGAVAGDVGITATPASDLTSDIGMIAVPGAAYDFAPDGIVFAEPVQLTIAYDENGLAGEPESALRLQKLVGGAWQVVPGSTVDDVANTVTGAIGGFSIYGAVTFPQGQALLTGWGTGVVDGVIGAGEWGFAGRLEFAVNIAGGATVPATMYVMNDDDSLYIAVRIMHSTSHDGMRYGVRFDANDNGLDEAGEDRFVGGLESGFNVFQDQHTSSACGGDRCSDEQNGGTDDGSSMLQFHGTHYDLETSRPLDSADANDFSITAGDVIGFNWGLFIFDEPPDNNGYLTEFPGAGTYARILIQQAPIPVLSGSGTATLDGAMGAQEWRNAACIFISIDVPEGGVTPGRWCVMNDATSLYVGLTYARTATDLFAFARMTLDNNNSDAIDNADDFFGYEAVGAGFSDGFWEIGTALCPSVICERFDTDAGGSIDGAGAFGQTATHAVFEQRHPLSSGDAFDISVSAGSNSGIALALFLTNQGGQSSATFHGGVTGMIPLAVQ